eukprot:TRINITY_DN543_c0_g2_i1.p1 TRINITY_DN543_c0_g2~~TRINITY_DN543_c0_g2_i1.p1  ORF type:complete len:593 (+),score=269.86 TRINITY_DN543_c0_g2_i1:52-1830(+)
MKIIDKIQSCIEKNQCYFSFEYFPPKTDDGVQNLFARLDRMAQLSPLFIDITWGAGGSTSERTLEICHNCQKFAGLETMMHLTCTNMEIEKIKEALDKVKDSNIQNILALRGDPPRGEEWKQISGGFGHAIDLVKYIRKNYGNYFGIAVAGYPEGHADAVSFEQDLFFLKEKIDAGADFVVTQLFYDCNVFLNFVQRAREIGINCPILPGIMPIHNYASFQRMTTFCKTKVPSFIFEALEPIKDDDEAVKLYGIELAVEMCQTLLKHNIKGFHFYTLNLEKSVTEIVSQLGFIDIKSLHRSYPWRACRSSEQVRPVFWAHRPKSYIVRTDSWDEFPNGRWGDTRSPAYGDLADYHLMSLHVNLSSNRRQLWGETIQDIQEVAKTFTKYCKGEIDQLPWNDLSIGAETRVISEYLTKLNLNQFLTINCQPRVNGELSTHPIYGWGGPGGWVFQKAYVEFFVNEEDCMKLKEIIDAKHPYLTYHAVNHSGTKSFTNTIGTNALTWGVFTGQQIKQPTVVDSVSFSAWKDEAFSLWKIWENLYEENSHSRSIISNIHSTWMLMNIVDNNFITGDLFAPFFEIINEKLSKSKLQTK